MSLLFLILGLVEHIHCNLNYTKLNSEPIAMDKITNGDVEIKLQLSPIKLIKHDVPEILIITRNFCRYSNAMRELLESNDIKFKEINVDKEGKDILDKLNLHNNTYPMVLINDEYIGGYEDAKEDENIKRLIKTDNEESEAVNIK